MEEENISPNQLTCDKRQEDLFFNAFLFPTISKFAINTGSMGSFKASGCTYSPLHSQPISSEGQALNSIDTSIAYNSPYTEQLAISNDL